MKVLLVRPFSVVFTRPYFTIKPPLSLGYLSAFLKENGHEVSILDFGLRKDSKYLNNVLKAFNPDIVGINAYTPNVLDAFELAREIKCANKQFITIIGGPHSTSIPEKTIEACPDLDFVIIGEGEFTLLELCDRIEKKKDCGQIAGLCYRHNGKAIRTNLRDPIRELDKLPLPDRDSLMPYYRKLNTFDHNINVPLNRTLEVITSRGCTDFCTFCTVHRAYREKGRSLRLRSAVNVLEEISICCSKYNLKHVSFLDDTFTINRARVIEIIAGLKRNGLTWNCDTRVNLLDKDLVRRMVVAGCKKMSIGVESGSERILRLINKNITIPQIKAAFQWCHEAGLDTVEANFLIGAHPEETLDDLRETNKLIKELMPQRLVVSIIVPFPGTVVREQMVERNLIFSNDWRRYILMNDEPPPWRTVHFTSIELRKLQLDMLAKFYFSFKNIVTNLKYIKSFPLLRVYFLSGLHIALEFLFARKKYDPR